MKFRTLQALVALVGSLGMTSTAMGFKQGDHIPGLLPSDKNHQLITALGITHSRALLPNFQSISFSLTAIENIQEWNAYTDRGAVVNYLVKIDKNGYFHDPEYHFDGDSFDKSVELLNDSRSKIISDIQSGQSANARKLLGQALHTIQDFYAHSNWVEKRLLNSAFPHPSWATSDPFGASEFTEFGSLGDASKPACSRTVVYSSAPLTTGYYDLDMSPPESLDRGAYTNEWRTSLSELRLSWPPDHCVHGGDGDSSGLNKDYDARPRFEEAKAAAKEATTQFVSGILNEIARQIAASTDPQPLADNLCEFLGKDRSVCKVITQMEEVTGILVADSERYADRWFRVAVHGNHLSKLLEVKIAGEQCESPVDGSAYVFVVRCKVAKQGVYQIAVEDRIRSAVLATNTIVIHPKDTGSPTLFARMGSAALIWLGDLYSKVVTAIWTVPEVVENYAVAVVDGVSRAFTAIFYSAGEVIADVTLKADSGLNDDKIKAKIEVVYVAKVIPFAVLAGDTVVMEIQGDNLPSGLAFNFPACATVSEITENSSTSVRRFNCAVSSKAEAGATNGTIGSPGPAGSPFSVLLHEFNIDVVKPVVAAVSAAPSPVPGGVSVVTVAGANLPKTANALVDEATCDLGTIVARPDGAGFSQSCAFGPNAGTKLVMVMSAGGASGFVIDDTKTLTVTASLAEANFVERSDSGSGWNLRVTVTPRDTNGNHGTFNFGSGQCTGTLTYKGKDNTGNYIFQENHLTGSCYKVCDIVMAADASFYNERCFGTAPNGTNYNGTYVGTLNRRWADPRPTSAQLDQLLGLTNVDVGGYLYVSTIDFKPTSQNIAVDTSIACRHGLVYNGPPYDDRPNTGDWQVSVPTAGTYRIKVNYSAELSRPVTASIDGVVFNSNALARVNGTWCSSPLMEEMIGEVTLTAGTHTLRLARGSVFPHLQHIVLQRTAGPEAVLSPVNGHRYEVIECGTWTSCRSAARAKGGELATVRSQAESEWIIANLLPKAKTEYGLWIGLNDEAQPGVWHWTSGEPITFTNWRVGEPNNRWVDGRAETYVHMWRGNSTPTFLPGVWNDIIDEPIFPIGATSIITQAIVEYMR